MREFFRERPQFGFFICADGEHSNVAKRRKDERLSDGDLVAIEGVVILLGGKPNGFVVGIVGLYDGNTAALGASRAADNLCDQRKRAFIGTEVIQKQRVICRNDTNQG